MEVTLGMPTNDNSVPATDLQEIRREIRQLKNSRAAEMGRLPTHLLTFFSTCCLCNPALGSLIDNAIEQQHRVINEMNQNFTDLEKASEKLIDLGTYIAPHKVPPKTVKITNTVAVKVPVPYPVEVPLPVPVPIPVNKPIPVPVPKIIKVPEPTPVQPTVSTASSYVTSPQSPTAVGTTVSSFSSRSSGPTSAHLLSGEQETAYSNRNEQFKEFVHSYPIHSVFDVGVDYNPYMGNRLARTKEATSASERHYTKHSDLEPLREYSSHNRIRDTHDDHYNYYQSTARPERGSSANQDYHSAYSTPEMEVIPHAYKSSKSNYFVKNSEKYPTPKFPRPTHSAFPTTPTFYTKQPSHEVESHYENQDYKEYRLKSPSTEHRLQSVKDSYPHYIHPDFKKYPYKKPEDYRESYSEHKHEKYVEHYQKPAEVTYPARYHQAENQEVEESREPSTHYKQYEYQKEPYTSHAESYPERTPSSDQYEHSEHYNKPNQNSEHYSHAETREPEHYAPQEYKTYYAKPSPVSEALVYLDEKERSHDNDHKDYYTNKLQHHRPRTEHEHKPQYEAKPSAITYDFPSDSHLHPSYPENSASKHKAQHYYSPSPEHPSFDEPSESEHKPCHHHPAEHSPSPSPSSPNHVNSYDHGESPSKERYRYYYPETVHYQQHHPHRHTEIASDMLESSSKYHEAYERAVEHDHRMANPNDHAEYSHEHLHHHHHPPS
ncbi:uncharacterized protein LOC128740240 [Sabethes cyaneus]|uniref:uncharacterized protein LOC128740240 n=1 Tax=Sabethes cyaneus TaxID=53552 RepID=UPI00237E33CA|nr:uncharacterized protein LOC128740240 [Sabethes cyaneus]